VTPAQKLKSLSEVPIGGSEDETKEKVKQAFKSNDPDKRWKNLSAEDIKELERQHNDT